MRDLATRAGIIALWGVIIAASTGIWNVIPALFVALLMPHAYASEWLLVFGAWNVFGLLVFVATAQVEEAADA